MSVRFDKKRGRWTVSVVFERADGTKIPRFRKDAPVQTRRGAEEYERQVRAAMLEGTFGREESLTLEAFADDFMRTYARANNKPAEYDTKNRILEGHLLPVFGALRLEEVSPERIEAYKAVKAAGGLKAKSINNHLTVLAKIFAVAVEWGKLKQAPAVKKLKTEEPDFDFLTFEEATRLLEHAGRWRLLLLVALRTGVRGGELRGLKWSDVDWTAGTLRVERTLYGRKEVAPKSGKARTIRLSPEVLAALRGARNLRGYVFAKEDGSSFTHKYLWCELQAVCERAGLRPISLHVLRHTLASHLSMLGRRRAAQSILGHSSSAMTDRYSHLDPAEEGAAVALLDAAGRQPGGNGEVVTQGKAVDATK